MWLKNSWYIAAFESELDQPLLARRLLDTPVVIFRTSEGEVSILEDVCPHRLLPLSMGRRVKDEIQCGYHGLRFAASGVCVEVPGQTQIPPAACAKRFPSAVRYGFIWVWFGKEELASPDLIPDLHWNADPDWVASRGYHLVGADYRLLNDNLLDLSHETYVHIRTIGNQEEESIANFPLEVTIEDEQLVRAHREMPDIDPPPFFRMLLNHEGLINRWQTAINLLPSINMTDAGVYPIGTDRAGAYVVHILHLLTPETETSTHYFWATIRNFRHDDNELTESIRKATSATFDEDKMVLERQQQQMVALNATVPRVAIRLDEAALRARRLLTLRIQEEQNAPDTVRIPIRLVEDAVNV